VEQPENGLRRICDFLGIDFENAMLDPATFIDYSLYSAFNEKKISSSKLNEWSKHKGMPTFKGSRYAWKNYPCFDFSKIPKHITQSLKALGYDTQMPRFYALVVALVTLKRYGKELTQLHLKDG
jgi:hypothetical protein